jgi:hypothetical protein
MTTNHEHPHGRHPHPKGRHHHHEHNDTVGHPHPEGPSGHHHPYEVTTPPPSPPPTTPPPTPPPPPPDGGGVDLPSTYTRISSGANIATALANGREGENFLVEGTYRLGAQIRPKRGQHLFAMDLGAATITAGSFGGTGVALAQARLTNLRIGGGLQSAFQLGNFGELVHCEIFECRENGGGSNQNLGGLIDRCEIHHCGESGGVGHNSGGVKLTATGNRGTGPGVKVKRSSFHDNTGNGLWWDVDAGSCLNDGQPAGDTEMGENPNMGDNFDGNFAAWYDRADVVEDCKIYNNTRRGVFWEVSRGPWICRRNECYRNNSVDEGNAAGIGVSAAKNALIEDNYSHDNNNWDISVGQITREGDRPWEPGYYIVRKVVVRNNRVGSLNKIRDKSLAGVTWENNHT